MFKRVSFLVAGVAMTAMATGCCCLSGYNRCNPCSNPCYSGYGGGMMAPASPCGPGGCAPTYGGYPTSYIPNDPSSAFAPAATMAAATPTPAASPMMAPAYPTTAFAPTQSLPTY